MMRRALFLVALSFGVARCSSCKSNPSNDSGAPSASASASTSAGGPSAASAPLSLPIAADHDANGNVYVAGFVAARSAVSLSRFDDHGTLRWAVDAMTGIGFSSDAHVDVVATPHGAAVVWRGIREKKRTRVARFVSDVGAVTGDIFPIGAGACAVGDSLFSVGGKTGSAVVVRTLPGGAEKTLVTLPDGHDPSLVCGETKRALIVDDGEDDIGVRTLDAEKAGARRLLLGPDDDDEPREHEDFAHPGLNNASDVLGDLLLTEDGHLVLRELGETMGARKKLEHVIDSEEDLMAADGNASHVVAIVQREATTRCDGEIATDVVAIDVPLPDGKENVIDVAHGDCGRDLGPYWVLPTNDAMFVAWNVRGPRNGDHAPVEALAWAKLGEPAHEVKLSAEDVVFAGCTKTRCMFAALARPEGTDGMIPGEARVVFVP